LRSRRVGATTFHRLMAEHGSADAALAALPEVARAAGVKDYSPCSREQAEAELERGRRAGARPIAFGAPDYPPLLALIPDAPPILWVMGREELLRRPMVALVGARNASSLGARMARRLATGLGEVGIVVVSGLARGIDAAAHLAALEAGTVAVMPGGVDVIYPTENATLAQEIAERGLRISERPPGDQPFARHFPARNRIISGLAQAVLVVEAAARSGSLITARGALDQGREVLAVPGHPFDARAAGCNMLIRDGATLVRGIDDVLEVLGLQALPLPASATPGRQAQVGEQESAALARSRARRVARTLAMPAGPEPTARSKASLSGTAPQMAPRSAGAGGDAGTDDPKAGRGAAANLAETAALHRAILDRLGPSPIAEDQLIRDLALPAARVTPELVALELEGRIQRQPGGLLSRVD
jgi:DNA processing protein